MLLYTDVFKKECKYFSPSLTLHLLIGNMLSYRRNACIITSQSAQGCFGVPNSCHRETHQYKKLKRNLVKQKVAVNLPLLPSLDTIKWGQ
jgi:hypothetical protein